jgi:hypothetical protein
MQIIHFRKEITSEKNRCFNASMSFLFLLVCVAAVSQFNPGHLLNQHRIHLSQTELMYSDAEKFPSVSTESVTPLVGKNQFILPDISPGTAKNIPSWNQLIGLRPEKSKASRTFQIGTTRPRLTHRNHAGTELVSAAISPVAPDTQRQARRIISNSHQESSDAALLSGLLSNLEGDESSPLRFPFNNCFALSLPRQDIENCVQIQYSLSSRRLIMQNRDLLDRLQMKRLEIRALNREILGAATQLKYEESLFSSEGHVNTASSDPTTTDDLNRHELLKWLEGEGRSKETDSVSENHEIRDDKPGVRGNAKAFDFSNLWNLLQAMVGYIWPS